MNTTLPLSIEAYLKEAGFSQTELLILRKLLEEDSLTVRELGIKMGKSTGVIDQAMKKLIDKKIIRKENVNGQPKYLIDSLDAIVRWVQRDMEERKMNLERRHESFSQFIATLKIDKKRPDMEHFSGPEGLKQAYDKLISYGGEVLTYTPILYLAEDDPLRAFRVDLFRRRQVRKIFQRILAPDGPLARRFQSRDAFEYRRTLLVPEAELPQTFEKTIVGDVVAYIDLKGQNASFLKYAELAKAETAAFDALWARTLAAEQNGTGTVSAGVKITVVPLSTRILSNLRQFFLGRHSLVALLLFAILSGMLTFGLYKTNRDLNLQRLKDKVLSIASTGALQFDAADVNAVWKPEDIAKPEYAKLVATLNLIRRSNTDIQYAYIMRKTDDPSKMTFVADADSLYPNQKKDTSGDGVIDDADSLNTPGEIYTDYAPFISTAYIQPLVSEAFDQWGKFISAQAAIRDKNGGAVAVLGVDMFASNLDRLSAATFTPLYAFFGFFLFFMLIRFWFENRSLMEECCEVMKQNMRRTILWLIFFAVFIASTVFFFLQYQRHILMEQTGERLKAIAVTAASEFDPDDLEQLHWARDMKTEAYQRVFKKLNEVRNKNPNVIF